MITKKEITEAWAFLRTNNHSISDEVLDFMKNTSINALEVKPEGNEAGMVQACKTCGVFVFSADGKICMNGHLVNPVQSDETVTIEYNIEHESTTPASPLPSQGEEIEKEVPFTKEGLYNDYFKKQSKPVASEGKENGYYEGIKISKNWDFIKSFKWVCENSKFIFSHDGRIKVITNVAVAENLDCFEIGYDRYGVTIEADTIFSNKWGSLIEDSGKNIVAYIKEYLIKEGASDLIIPASEGKTAEEVAEELWDKYSNYIEDDLDSFQLVVGRSMINRTDFLKAMNEYRNH